MNPVGNLAATLVMRPGGLPAWAALRSFLAANALFETLALYCDRDCLSLKWPNDVLLDERKVAGILLESAGNAREVDWLDGKEFAVTADDVIWRRSKLGLRMDRAEIDRLEAYLAGRDRRDTAA